MAKRSGRNPSRDESGRDDRIEPEVQRQGRHEGDGEIGLSGAEHGSQRGDKGTRRQGGQQGGRQQEGQRPGQQQGTESTRRGKGSEERQPVEEGRPLEGEEISEEEPGKRRNR